MSEGRVVMIDGRSTLSRALDPRQGFLPSIRRAQGTFGVGVESSFERLDAVGTWCIAQGTRDRLFRVPQQSPTRENYYGW